VTLRFVHGNQRSLRALALAGALVIVALMVPSSSSASGVANSFGPEMFGISAGGDLQNEDAATLGRDLDEMEALDARWVRMDINWGVVQANGPSSYNWGPFDRVIDGATDRGIDVVAVIERTPGWARPAGTSSTFGPDPAKYAAFVGKAVARYAAMGVHTYEVWNEPNIPAFWTPSPDPVAYTKLLKAAYPEIKAADPEATVLTGGTAPAGTNGTTFSPVDFLRAVYDNGGGDSFDAVSHHPYSWHAYPGEAKSWSAWHQMYGTNPSLRSVMADNGDSAKKIWGTEWGAPTNGPAGSFVSEATQAQMVTKAYSLWKTYDWAGPLLAYEGRDFGTGTDTRENFFGLLRHDYSKKPSYTAYRDAVDNLNTDPGEDTEPGEDPGPGGDSGGGTGTGDSGGGTGTGGSGGTSDPGGTDGSTPTETTVKGKGYGKGGKKAGGAARGKVVSTADAPTNARKPALRGEVKLTLYRKSGRGWRAVSGRQTTALTVHGRFRERLSCNRRKVRPGTFRVHARYLGSDGAMPSASHSRRFKLR
jgi:polysaccharide biosynthesis protein PslG